MKKYKIWVCVLRIILMGLPSLLVTIFEWLFDKSEELLYWLDRKLPDPWK